MNNSTEYKRPDMPLILVVDDMENNRKIIGATLLEAGYEVSVAPDGLQAIEMVELDSPDLILLDIDMPVMDGYETCAKLKEMENVKNIPVIFFTAAKKETHDVIEGLKLGGVDYVIKQFDEDHMAVLLQRIKNHLEIKFFREEIQHNSNQIKSLYDTLNNELEKAANYVQSLIPEEIDDDIIKTTWQFYPSAKLGGDSFGYHWLDEENFLIYLLDVAGHGVGPSLHSVSVFNALRNQTLPDVDFTKPESLLKVLNESYPMAEHNMMYFTMWYGVYNSKNRTLRHAAAGHPPAYMINGSNIQEVGASCHIIGALPDVEFESGEITLSKGASLYIFSDGAFEVKDNSGKMWTPDKMAAYLADNIDGSNTEIQKLFEHVKELNGGPQLSDDFSMLKVEFK